MYSKKSQLSKGKKENPKKMSAQDREEFENFILILSSGKCQCGCGRDGVEYHHSKRGAYKDDRSIMLICRRCHTLIHNCEYKNIDESSRLTLLAKEKGKYNWSQFNG